MDIPSDFFSYKKLHEYIQTIIRINFVSLNIDSTGQIREYSVQINEHQTMVFVAYSYAGGTEYEISLDDMVLLNIQISDKNRFHTPREELVIKIFNLCSSRVVSQEIEKMFGDMNQKTYS